MPRRRSLLLTLGSIGLAASLALGLQAAWPSPRRSIRIDIAAAPLDTTGASPSGGSIAPAATVPAVAVRLDLPTGLLRGRPERLGLRLESPATGDALTLSAGIVSSSLSIQPPGESGQALIPGASFHWTATAAQGPHATATIVLRVRRAGEPDSASAERLLLARDVSLPVRSAFGLSAVGAVWTSGALALAAAGLLVAAARRRTD
jgi:hypothetical protein